MKTGGLGCIDVGDRHEDQEHDPQVVDLAAPRLDRHAVAQLVERFDDGIKQPKGQYFGGTEGLGIDCLDNRRKVGDQ